MLDDRAYWLASTNMPNTLLRHYTLAGARWFKMGLACSRAPGTALQAPTLHRVVMLDEAMRLGDTLVSLLEVRAAKPTAYRCRAFY